MPRSREVVTALSLVTAGFALTFFDNTAIEALKQTMILAFKFTHAEVHDPSRALELLTQQIAQVVLATIPLFVCMMLAALLSPAVLGGFSMSLNSLSPKADRLNLIKGLGNIFSSQSVVEVIKALSKATLVALIAYFVLKDTLPLLTSLNQRPLFDGIRVVGSLLYESFFKISAGLVLIALIDAPYQLYRYKKKHMMSKQELKQEYRQADGNPEVRAKIRRQQREIASRQMWSQIPEADVVLSNPTHYAVAIKYRENEMHAPIVVAKGIDEIAVRIRMVAQHHEVILLESPKLARSLHAHTEIGEQIPQALFLAVAEILAFVFELKEYKNSTNKYPVQPDERNVPDEFDPLSSAKDERATS